MSLSASELDVRVMALTGQEKVIHLIGLPDHSQQSLDEVDRIVAEINPDTVCFPLCETRFRALTDEATWRQMKIVDVLRQGRMLLLLANLAASTFQHGRGRDVAVRLGDEMLGRIAKAEALGARLEFGDRDLQITLKRSWKQLSARQRARAMLKLIQALVFKPEKPDPEPHLDSERSIHNALRRSLPEFEQPFFEEADQYLMSSIERADGHSIVAVVHESRLDGVARHFNAGVDRESLGSLPARSKLAKLMPWLASALVIGMVIYGLLHRPEIPAGDLLLTWALPNWICTGLFLLPAGPRFLSFFSALVVTPFTPLSPFLRTGLVVGLLEGWLRRPLVSDCEQIPRDLRSLRGIYGNRLTRVLLVAWLGHIGSSLGNYVGVFMLFRLLT
ncbi:TraB/GumN family protein [Sulfidibacter corallicola]|uniref:TraB/GumN family protein n=1 Tax=Sulfidibacter corallicola TaxID=2818388 RepID=A0A8A4TJ10_SULCO|nr:TraB/GumN family protein [Sulfidibacter corallicola]QTD49142.1 TraB/GumN family protein [Sulfidibacter corallicola]